ncbi:hypothetical protein HMPREF9621_01217 [Cutibacterium modestum HL037PA2]|nr:hypothetical protein HMPREF9621_01217 [Cutibacterium modestum HL037PA2]
MKYSIYAQLGRAPPTTPSVTTDIDFGISNPRICSSTKQTPSSP